MAGRARVVSVGEKLMRAGSDGVLNRQKPLTAAVSQDKSQREVEIRAPSQLPGEKGQTVDMVPTKRRISPPKTHNLDSVHSK